MKRSKGKLKVVEFDPQKRSYNIRRKYLPSNTILICVIVITFSAIYYFEKNEVSLASLEDKLTDAMASPTVKKQGSLLEGLITHVRDGDTFEVNGVPVRIAALDCPENSTSAGQKVTRFVKQFKGKKVRCELTGAKTYDRVVGYCSIDGKDFGKTMMDQTACNLWAKYDVWNRY